MKICIVEDNLEFAKKLERDVVADLSAYIPNIETKIFDENFINVVEEGKVDIVFLDIDLKYMNGIKLAELIRKNSNIQPVIIFVSNKKDFVFSSFKVRPFGFVRKMEYDKDIHEIFLQLREYFKEVLSFVTFELHGRKTAIFIKDIIYIEAYGHNVDIVTEDEVYTYRATMKKVLEMIGVDILVRISKFFSINLDYVQEINKNTITLANNKQYKIGRKYKENVLAKYEENLIK